jgi:glucose-6-phosphate-specific signal transduction histidine kinase
MRLSTFSLKVDRPLLLSDLISGAVWLFLALLRSGPILPLIGAAYVVAGSVFLSAVYAHERLTVREEALTWLAPWLVAVALWAGIVIAIEFENSVSHYLLGLHGGVIIATPCYLVWQIVALVVRQLMVRRSGEALHVTQSSD